MTLLHSALILDGLVKLAQMGESPTVEFKKSTAEKERACRTLCAFANGQGGQLLFEGVNGGVSGGVSESLLRYIAANPGQRAKTLAEALDIPLRTTERWIKQLCKTDLVEFVGPPKTGGYHARKLSKAHHP